MPIVRDRLSSLALVGTRELHNLQSALSFVVQIEKGKMIPPCFCLHSEAGGTPTEDTPKRTKQLCTSVAENWSRKFSRYALDAHYSSHMRFILSCPCI